MAYTTPLKVFQSMERIDTAVEQFSNVSSGDSLVLDNQYIVKDAYPSKDQTVVFTVDGVEQSPDDYEIDFETNELSYTGSDSGDAEVEYKYAPYSDSVVQDSIAAAEEYIDDYTNTTYEGLVEVTDEVYDGAGNAQRSYVFVRRPVRSVLDVSVNRPDAGSDNPNYVELSEGVGEDYTTYKELGIRFTGNGVMPRARPRELKVSYEYGFTDLPSDIERAATEMVIDDLVRGTVSGAMVDGRDNFDPQTVDVMSKEWREVLDRYRIQRMSSLVNLAEQGEMS